MNLFICPFCCNHLTTTFYSYKEKRSCHGTVSHRFSYTFREGLGISNNPTLSSIDYLDNIKNTSLHIFFEEKKIQYIQNRNLPLYSIINVPFCLDLDNLQPIDITELQSKIINLIPFI